MAVLLVLAAATMTAATVLPSPLRAIVALPIALLAPGASLLVLLRGRWGGDDEVDPGTDAALCVVLSFIAWVLIAVGLYIAGIRLRTPAVVAAGDALILSGAAGAALRARPRDGRLRGWSDSLVAPLLLAATVAVTALAVVVVPHLLPSNPSAPYSSISLGGAWAGLGTPVVARPSQEVAVEIGVENHTHRRRVYVVGPAMAGATWSGDSVTLDPGGSWTGVVSGHVPAGGCLHRLAITLSERGSPQRIGTLTVWLQSATTLPKRCKP
jgi:uncharacterized membrane protein